MNAKRLTYSALLLCLLSLCNCSGGSNEEADGDASFSLNSIVVGSKSNTETFANVDPNLQIILTFSEGVDSTTTRYITLKDTSGQFIDLQYKVSGKIVTVQAASVLSSYSTYHLSLASGVKSINNASLIAKTYTIQTALDSTDKFNRISDEDLLTLVQKQTFKYFWDFGHSTSGMARERSTSGDVVTTGGTGFGIMAMIAATERGFITRAQSAERLLTIVNFLTNNCTRYHGAFAHWINGATGQTVPFSTYDDGADLVETAFLFEGLLTARAYFSEDNANETAIRTMITSLWKSIEWTWFQKDGSNVLYWHWSPNYGWQMNQKITGWNEALMVYLLAASSPDYPISKEVYENGWAQNGNIKNTSTYYNYTLPLGSAYGGPLFLAHYSFLGLKPYGLSDQYADYWTQNQNHTLINYSYCVANPNKYTGYSKDCWGLTASDGNSGYSAYSPTNDKGVIAPTAAISSLPYTPEQSMNALRFFYYKLGDKIWKDYGFVDAFNLSVPWFDTEYIAIDQGPIVVMIENYRTGLLWNLFMNIEEIKEGYSKLGFQVSN